MKPDCIPARYTFVLLASFALIVMVSVRSSFNIAITRMVVSHPIIQLSEKQKNDVCPISKDYYTGFDGKTHTGEFKWDEETQGRILAAFYYGYVLTHLPGGVLSEKFGGKYTLGLGILLASILTLMTPKVAYYGPYALMLLRFFEGIGEGTIYPSLYTMMVRWIPPSERNFMSSLIFLGNPMGNVIANTLSGFILQYSGNWKAVFYVIGLINITWFVCWCLLCYNDPESHPFISAAEKEYLKDAVGETERKKDLGKTPWKSMLSSPPVLALIMVEIGHDWAVYTMMTDLPKYLNDVLKFNPLQNGFSSALPFAAVFVMSLVIGPLSDWSIRAKLWTLTVQRKLFVSLCTLVPAVGVICASYVGCNKTLATACFTIGYSFMAFTYTSINVNAMDLSPNYSGTLMALVNGAGALSGMLTPQVAGLLTPHRDINEWRIVFWIMFGLLFCTNLIFLLFGSTSLQAWNEPQKKEEEYSLRHENNLII